jgi:hypothetical protein
MTSLNTKKEKKMYWKSWTIGDQTLTNYHQQTTR